MKPSDDQQSPQHPPGNFRQQQDSPAHPPGNFSAEEEVEVDEETVVEREQK